MGQEQNIDKKELAAAFARIRQLGPRDPNARRIPIVPSDSRIWEADPNVYRGHYRSIAQALQIMRKYAPDALANINKIQMLGPDHDDDQVMYGIGVSPDKVFIYPSPPEGDRQIASLVNTIAHEGGHVGGLGPHKFTPSGGRIENDKVDRYGRQIEARVPWEKISPSYLEELEPVPSHRQYPVKIRHSASDEFERTRPNQVWLDNFKPVPSHQPSNKRSLISQFIKK